MGEMDALWAYDENHDDMEQLGQKLLCTTLELEKLKSEAMEEMRKNKEYIKQLIYLLKRAIQERDEAKTHLHTLLNRNDSIPLTTKPADESFFLLKPNNSSITESNSLSETYSYHSPVDSSEFSNVNAAAVAFSDNHREVVDRGLPPAIDSLVSGRALPQKGKLLQAVLRAGPLLQTLLMAGPLPRWRNPPQFQPFQMPLVPPNLGQLGLDSRDFGHASCGPAQVRSVGSMLSFGNMVQNGQVMPSGMSGVGYAPSPKRQRFC